MVAEDISDIRPTCFLSSKCPIELSDTTSSSLSLCSRKPSECRSHFSFSSLSSRQKRSGQLGQSSSDEPFRLLFALWNKRKKFQIFFHRNHPVKSHESASFVIHRESRCIKEHIRIDAKKYLSHCKIRNFRTFFKWKYLYKIRLIIEIMISVFVLSIQLGKGHNAPMSPSPFNPWFLFKIEYKNRNGKCIGVWREHTSHSRMVFGNTETLRLLVIQNFTCQHFRTSGAVLDTSVLILGQCIVLKN